MKFVDSKVLQKPDSKKKIRYLLTVELSDYDIEMFEEFGAFATAEVTHWELTSSTGVYYTKMNDYLKNTFHNIFQRLWRKHECD